MNLSMMNLMSEQVMDTMNKRVFRVEWPDGLGVYQDAGPRLDDEGSYSAAEFVGMDDSLSSDHPSPQDDTTLSDIWSVLKHDNDDWRYIFGFKSFKQAAEWFYDPEWLTKLNNIGIVLSEYRIVNGNGNVYYGETQAIFIAHHATLVRHHKMVDLLPYITG